MFAPRTILMAGLLLALCGPNTRAEETADYMLLKPITGASAGGVPVMRPLDEDDPRYRAVARLLELPFNRWVLEVGAKSRELAIERSDDPDQAHTQLDHPAIFVIMPQGNRPKQGLAIRTDTGTEVLPKTWYVEIDHQRADTLVPHEYGHVMMFQSLPGDMPPHPRILPHTTGAITNDVTAFSEGWGIHFETLSGDYRENGKLYQEFHRDEFPLDGPPKLGDSLLPVRDLMTFAQSYRRYTAIKENWFACLPRPLARFAANAEPSAEDVLARWTDATHDPARIKTLEQMVASEGLIATLFYRLATAPDHDTVSEFGPALPDPGTYAAFFAAFAELTEERASETPLVLTFLGQLMDQADDPERRRIARIAQEVFHYTLTLSGAPELYAHLHLVGHRLDADAYRKGLKALDQSLTAALDLLIEEPFAPTELVAPELWLQNDRLAIDLPLLGLHRTPLVLDLNTAPITLLMTLPSVDYATAAAIAERRSRLGGFRTLEQLRGVPELGDVILAELKRMHGECLKSIEDA